MKCPSCGKQIATGDMFCDGPGGCGFPLPQAKSEHQRPSHHVIGEVHCTQCDRANASVNSFCYYCGGPLGQKIQRQCESTVSSTPLPAKTRLVTDDSEILVTENPMWISRDHFKGIVTELDTNYISRRHFAISFENGSYYAEDEGSSNNTWVNGVEIRGKGKYKLENGDKINAAGVITLTFKK